MNDKRPKQLLDNIKHRMSNNDSELSDALDQLQADVLKGKIKPTMANLRKYSKLSEGSIRSRTWAMLRFKTMKQAVKDQKKAVGKKANEKVKTETQMLKERIRGLLTENAILFNEIKCLQETVSRRDSENQVLTNRLQIKAKN